jgi:diguanylate cyclase (GGDEF)-like protein
VDEATREDGVPVAAAALHLLLTETTEQCDHGVQRTLEAIPLVALSVDFDGTVLSINGASRESAGLATATMLGRGLTDTLDPASAQCVSNTLTAMAGGTLQHAHVVASMAADHSRALEVALTLAVVHDEGGRPSCAVVFAREYTERDRDVEELRFRAFHDPLTDLPNRTAFVDRLVQALARADRQGSWSAVLFIDLDGFKAVNDTLGHAAGDELLFSSAGRISAVMRPEDTLARYGGDEFTVLCEDLHGPEEVDAIAIRVLGVFGKPFLLSAGQALLSASIGAAVIAGGSGDATSVVAAADAAMYASKHAGPAGYVVRPLLPAG